MNKVAHDAIVRYLHSPMFTQNSHKNDLRSALAQKGTRR